MDEVRAFLDWLYDECAVPDWAPRDEVLAAYQDFLEEQECV
jgi:hypothetical protein